jgi:hypothetical protein
MTLDLHSPVATWVRHVEALAALRVALRALDGAGIPALAVKGVVLAHQLYDDVSKRPISDIDLRVRPRDFVDTVRTLQGCGLRADFTSKQLGAIGFPMSGILLEIECTIGPPGLCGMSVEEAMDRGVERTLPGGVRVLEPDPVDHAVLLVVNAFKDKLVECPQWSRDDLQRLVRHPLFDRSVFLARVRKARIDTITWIVGDWLARDYGSESWAGLRDALDRETINQPYIRLMTGLFRGCPHSLATRLMARVGSDSMALRVGAVAAALTGAGISSIARRVAASNCSDRD